MSPPIFISNLRPKRFTCPKIREANSNCLVDKSRTNRFNIAVKILKQTTLLVIKPLDSKETIMLQ